MDTVVYTEDEINRMLRGKVGLKGNTPVDATGYYREINKDRDYFEYISYDQLNEDILRKILEKEAPEKILKGDNTDGVLIEGGGFFSLEGCLDFIREENRTIHQLLEQVQDITKENILEAVKIDRPVDAEDSVIQSEEDFEELIRSGGAWDEEYTMWEYYRKLEEEEKQDILPEINIFVTLLGKKWNSMVITSKQREIINNSPYRPVLDANMNICRWVHKDQAEGYYGREGEDSPVENSWYSKAICVQDCLDNCLYVLDDGIYSRIDDEIVNTLYRANKIEFK